VIAFTGIDQAQATTTINEFIRGMATAETTLDVSGTQSNFEQYGIYFDDSEEGDRRNKL
jgi:hypothetical protein